MTGEDMQEIRFPDLTGIEVDDNARQFFTDLYRGATNCQWGYGVNCRNRVVYVTWDCENVEGYCSLHKDARVCGEGGDCWEVSTVIRTAFRSDEALAKYGSGGLQAVARTTLCPEHAAEEWSWVEDGIKMLLGYKDEPLT
ncbi:hypothetical protein ACPC3D_30885 [Streptomyces cellulosae]